MHRKVLFATTSIALLLAGCAGRPATAGYGRPGAGDPLSTGEHQVVLNGVRIWYRVAGEESGAVAPVVFLHGGPGQGSQSFAALAGPLLERHLRMVYLDQRGSGRSERPWNRAYSIDLLVEDLEALRRELGVERINIVSQSFGAVPALEYAARYPERVERMVIAAGLSDASGSIRSGCERLARVHPEAYERSMEEARGRGSDVCDLFGALSDDEQRRRFFDENMFPIAETQRLIELHDTAGGLRNTGELGGAVFEQGLLEWRFTRHDRLTMPVLVIAGELDHQVGLANQRALAESLPNGDIVVYEGAGHFMFADEPERFARDLSAFFRGDE